MIINKLIISPLRRGYSDIVFVNPGNSAGLLIKERLNAYPPTGCRKALGKLPEFLCGFVNPKSRVIPEKRFSLQA